MGGSIFLRQGDELVEMRETPYEAEAVLQELLASYPELLAGDQVDRRAPRRWLLVSREMGVPAKEEGAAQWSLDHLFLDQEGIPTLVEVKRSSDTRIRREVVGQMLDYAANGVAFWPVEQIKAMWEASSDDAEGTLKELLLEERSPDQFWENVKMNLQAGKVRMVFVADEIPPELLRIVQFLSEQLDPAEVFALEVRQYAGEGQVTLVPRIVGQRARPPITPPMRIWDEATFMEELRARSSTADEGTAQRLLAWARGRTLHIDWGKGSKDGSLYVRLDQKTSLFCVWTNARVQIQFEPLKQRRPFDEESKRLELLMQLNRIPGISLPDDPSRYPSFPLSALSPEQALERFQNAFDWAVDELRTT